MTHFMVYFGLFQKQGDFLQYMIDAQRRGLSMDGEEANEAATKLLDLGSDRKTDSNLEGKSIWFWFFYYFHECEDGKCVFLGSCFFVYF